LELEHENKTGTASPVSFHLSPFTWDRPEAEIGLGYGRDIPEIGLRYA
jgi:hypothetical protein